MLKTLCATEWRQSFVRWQVVGRWTRLYSEVQLIELQTTAATHRLIAKRAVRRPGTAIYHERGDVARREFEALRQAEAALAALPECGVPRAYGIVPGDDWLLMEYVSGAELDRQIAGARWLTPRDRQLAAERHFERLGSWLQTYQRATATRVDASALDGTLGQCQQRLVELSAVVRSLRRSGPADQWPSAGPASPSGDNRSRPVSAMAISGRGMCWSLTTV